MLLPDALALIDIRVGTVLTAVPFPQARQPAYQLTIDFGPEIGIKQSSAQITALYSTAELVGRQVLAVVNLAPKQIGPFLSQVLVLGCSDHQQRIVLAAVEQPVPNGARLH